MNNFFHTRLGSFVATAAATLFFCSYASPLCAQEGSVPVVNVDQLVQNVRFQFRPDPLQDAAGNTAVVQGYFNKTPGFPLWLMTDMGGALLVDNEHFSVNESAKDKDGTWILDLSCVDSINGFFKLNFAIDSKSGDAALKLATLTDGDIAIYQGKIGPYEEEKTHFKNEKRTQDASQTAAILDQIIPALDFNLKLNSELYGNKAYIKVTPKKITARNPRQFSAEDFQVICCEKQNDIWYVRLGVGQATEVTEEMVLDLAIDANTGDANYRMGFADKLRLNWRTIFDGRIQMPEKK